MELSLEVTWWSDPGGEARAPGSTPSAWDEAWRRDGLRNDDKVSNRDGSMERGGDWGDGDGDEGARDGFGYWVVDLDGRAVEDVDGEDV